MSNEDIIVDERMASINPLYIPNHQTKLMINSNVNISKRACKNMSLDTSEHLLLVYVDEDKR